ncbi:MAG: hypothetical protein HY885_16365 [Deltaproteobacteria bacterium]|nr:hypothetical protein [Deltaproteobacteria bacterium]
MEKRLAPFPPDLLPATLLILGTDLAGKDHVANVVADDAEAAGLKVERRRGAFSARTGRQRTSEEKGLPRLWAEWSIILTAIWAATPPAPNESKISWSG